MPKMVITHAVEDIERWLDGKQERATMLGTVGNDVTDHVAVDGSKKVAITMDVHDPEGAQAMMASPSAEVVAAMEKHGVVQPMTAYVER